jgi:hypothetical protein
MSAISPREPSFVLLMGLAWLLVVFQLVAQNWAAMAVTFPDADDAMRMVQVRDLILGHEWFNLHQDRLNPPFGYDSHWSRLIDAGLAGLFLLFNLFVPEPLAERLMSAAWPLLWLIPTIGAVAAIAWRLGGREAAVVALLLSVFAIPGFQQFRPGRIDHHNVHIALALLAAAATVWSDRVSWCAYAAGALAGLGVAIGFEAVAFHLILGAAFALRYVADPSGAAALRAYLFALALSTLVAFLISVNPGLWTRSICDVLAVNSVTAIVAGCIGLTVATVQVHDGRAARLLACLLCAAAALLVFLMFEPRCIAGPFALVDPAIRPIWLDYVSEAQSIFGILGRAPSTAFAMLSFPLAALFAVYLVAREPARRRDFGFLIAASIFLFAFVLTIGAIRGYSYAIWLGLPLMAAAAVQSFARFKITGLVPRFLLALLITPMALTMGTIVLARAAGQDKLLDLDSPERQACVRKENYDLLARLPRGLVVVNALEWAPYLLVWTPQPVLAAPYHRMPAGIVSSHQALASPPAQARAVMHRVGVAYVATCGSQGPEGLNEEQRAASLWAHLQAGAIPDWLERVPESQAHAFAVYRVK